MSQQPYPTDPTPTTAVAAPLVPIVETLNQALSRRFTICPPVAIWKDSSSRA